MTPRVAADYGPEITGLSRGVLLEVFSILGAYKDGLTLVGGWAPYLFLEDHQSPDDDFIHVGSIDIDLAVDPRKVDDDAYASIVERLTTKEYVPKVDKNGMVVPASYERKFQAKSKEISIQIDFLTAEEFGSGSHRHAVVQGSLHARRSRGCDAAFTHFEEHEIVGTLPTGGTRSMTIRVADLVGILAMKGIVMGERFKEKDAYDIHSVVAHMEGGPAAAAKSVAPSAAEDVVRAGLAQIRNDFSTLTSNGPTWAATFMAPEDRELHQRHQADAFLTLREFFQKLDLETK